MATLARIITAGAITVIMAAILWVALPLVSEDFLWFRTGGMPQVFTETHDGVSVVFAYPFFGRSGVDADIERLRQRFIEDVSQVQEQSEGDEQVEATSLTVTYRVVHRTWRSVSILFSAAVTISEAHTHDDDGEQHVHEGPAFVFGRTYDLLEDRPLSLSEMTGGHPDALRVLAQQVIEGVGNRPEIDALRVEQNVRPGPDLLEQAVRSDEGITVYLNPGQVAPREAGIIEVTVPLSAFIQ